MSTTTLETKEQARVEFAEADMSALEDKELRKTRKQMIAKHGERFQAFQELGDNRYSTPEGNTCMRDMNYYSNCIARLESEMQYRMLTLD